MPAITLHGTTAFIPGQVHTHTTTLTATIVPALILCIYPSATTTIPHTISQHATPSIGTAKIIQKAAYIPTTTPSLTHPAPTLILSTLQSISAHTMHTTKMHVNPSHGTTAFIPKQVPIFMNISTRTAVPAPTLCTCP